MTRQNRPYSLNDIVAALQNTHGKAAISKAVDDLVNEDALYEKLNGKQKVFVIPQSNLPRPDDNELLAMDRQIEELMSTLKELQERIKSAESVCCSDKNQEYRAILYENGHAWMKKIAEQRCQAAVAEWKKRKRMAMEIIDAVAEGYPKSRRQMMVDVYKKITHETFPLQEDMGVETDEDRGVSLSAFV
ncbi:unnamed protein product [Schistocephalus solidus]|uniref:TBPIP domain-containing protein n=1 Tax=Schistocephalus solidus TaxID=70667 RepID=A0A183T9P0_SCHSO|nr:unnamed protein product [Schistocephalus solidus]